jgi:hypothetical protein
MKDRRLAYAPDIEERELFELAARLKPSRSRIFEFETKKVLQDFSKP